MNDSFPNRAPWGFDLAKEDSVEILLMHMPLADVLAFVNVRDDVRCMCESEPPPSDRDTVSARGQTMRIAAYVEAAEAA